MRFCGILIVMAVMIVSGCTLGREAPQGNTSSISTPIPTFTPAPRPTQTPIPVTNLSQIRAEQIVLEVVRSCAEQLAEGPETPVLTAFTSVYEAGSGKWKIDAFSGDEEFGLGHWEISDFGGNITPADEAAVKIASADFNCERPRVLLAQGMTPPVFSTPIPTPSPNPTSVPKLSTQMDAREAELVVWQEVLSCAGLISGDRSPPMQLTFSSDYDTDLRNWVVEVSSLNSELTFGTWEVDGLTGVALPQNDIAAKVGDPGLTCKEPNVRMDSGLTPPTFVLDATEAIVATGDDARRVVWLAVYGCFSPPPRFEAFAAYENGANGWIVEGRVPVGAINEDSETSTYGLWVLKALDEKLNPFDDTARDISNRTCFRNQ